MASPLPFILENLVIEHSVSPMKIGTDALLLGAYPKKIFSGANCLDIGSGCGIITLMTARLNPEGRYTCVDIDEGATAECNHNIHFNGMSEYCRAVCCDITRFGVAYSFDVIFSNPPFFDSKVKPQKKDLLVAKHQELLSFTDLAKAVNRLLSKSGFFYIILPGKEAVEFEKIASSFSIHPVGKLFISSFKGSGVIREITVYQKAVISEIVNSEHLFLYRSGMRNDWSEEYRQMLRKFKKFD